MPAHWYAVLTAVASAGVQFALFLRWLHRRMRNDEITRAFVRDIATNHLPHIYNALQKIAAEQGIELDDTPLVRFDDLFLSALCDPDEGLAVGCKVLRRKFDAMAGDATRALLAWNGGGNATYAAQVLARRAHYL